MNNTTQPQGDQATPPPPPLPGNTTGEFTDYSQLPWYRKSGVQDGLILASILTGGLFPGTIIVCIDALTGDVYFNKKDERGYLKKWHWGNKVVAVLLLLLNIAALIQLFAAMSR